ncbi:MAG TPA: hypothetical protein DEP18_02550 [Flavobacteriales bacterium]|nr:hypothetical protein [Flavobacteriales bacterium]HCA82639.1 hypothetical protein [Flavobacteriales bacterium]HRE75365.1 DUF6364 family protein [Flavobacteriales bacterium]HRE95807.1 DUF6364 family protein [Flavobacteriales bacterium]HRJ37574.1 DUF6364 family protein [Flavobacteriales bacterium]
MDYKLTLSIDNQIVERAKRYAKNRNISLSKLIERYLEFLTTDGASEYPEAGPLVKSISGVLEPDAAKDYKKTYKAHLKKKYSR